jgi:hypothetical protein
VIDLAAVAALADSDFNVRQEAKSEPELSRVLHEIATHCDPDSRREANGALARMSDQMPNRTKTAASPIFAAFLASVFSTAIACAAARAADDCLSEPKHQAPPGGHWYYRIDGPNHRKCWFLGDEGQKVSQAGSPRPSSPLPLPRRAAEAIQPSVADAHAELPKVTTPPEPPQWLGPTRPQWLGPTGMNPEKITEVVPDASPSETLSPPSARDPEGETRVLNNGVVDGQSRTESRTELLPPATDREPAAELSAEETTAGPWLALLLIALGLATIAGSLIFKLSAAVQAGRRDVFRSR